MRILGIDPGSRVTGFGVVERAGNRIVYVESGCVRAGDGDFPERLRIIFDGVRDIVRLYSPTEAAIEKVFMHRNADSALKLGQARGAAICALMAADLVIREYTPSEVKLATVGKGNAGKEQVQHMIQSILKLPGRPQPDAADALAIALCHMNTRQTLAHLATAAARTTGGGRRGRYGAGR